MEIRRSECNKSAPQNSTTSPNYPNKAWMEVECLLSSQLEKIFRIEKIVMIPIHYNIGKHFIKKVKSSQAEEQHLFLPSTSALTDLSKQRSNQFSEGHTHRSQQILPKQAGELDCLFM